MRLRGINIAVAALVSLSGSAAAARANPFTLVPSSTNANSEFGRSVAGVPDVDGDGRGDLVVGASGDTVGGLTFAGRVYVFSGATGALIRSHASPNANASGAFGWSVAGVPDVNGDGRGDYVVGAPLENPGGISSAGRAYLYSGANGALLRTFTSPNAELSGLFGISVAGTPDVNADGRGDVIIGAYAEDPGASPDGAGRAYVYSGSTGSLLFTLVSPNEEVGGAFGFSVAGVIDANSDARGDILVGAYQEDPGAAPNDAGRAYLFSGANGTVLRTFSSPNQQANGYFGFSVSSGLITDDARGDVLIGAWGEDLPDSMTDAGRAYSFNGFTGAFYYTLESPYPEVNGRFGYSVSGVPDVNGDGRYDALVGAPNEDPATAPTDSGRAYLFRTSSSLAPPLRIFVSPSEESAGSFGYAVAGVADADGDGRGDVLIGARLEDPGALPSNAGQAYRFGMAASRVLVRSGATGANDGSSWANGWTDLQAAIDFVIASNYTPAEVWVAAGTYKPDVPGGNTLERFEMRNGLALYGGFAGNETSLAQRNPAVNVTILSGDLNGNDGPNFTQYSDNSLVIISALSVNSTAVVDGFTIQSANGPGISIVSSSPSISNCTIRLNHSSGSGGGVAVGGTGCSPTLSDCIITGNLADSEGGGVAIDGSTNSILLNRCVLSYNAANSNSGGGIRVLESFATLTDCDIIGNTALFGAGIAQYNQNTLTPTLTCDNVSLESNVGTYSEIRLTNGAINLQGPLTVVDGRVQTLGFNLSGIGTLFLEPAATLEVYEPFAVFNAPPLMAQSTLQAAIKGAGTVQVFSAGRLTVDNGGLINLDPAGASQCNMNSASAWGSLEVMGSLRIRNGTIRNANITVHNDVSVGQCGNESGGQLVLEQSAAALDCNKITSYGDRYAIYPPSLTPAPTVVNNKVTAIITPDLSPTDEGEIFELRQNDNVCPTCPGGLNLLNPPSHDAFNDRWALDELRLLAGAKLNLTNRPGFIFGGAPESLFARKITLYPGAILNTAFQRLFYNSLVNELDQPLDPQNLPVDRDVKDIPLLGFSLGVITFEDECEFNVRLRKRTLGGNGQSGSISRITSNISPPIPPCAGGIMQMRTNNADSVAAKGIFNKQIESKVLVSFKYLWPQTADPGEIRVFLSDSPDVGSSLSHIATIKPPLNPSDPGGAASNRFAEFQGRFARTQDLSRGAHVELQLVGSGSRVWIDDFDPVVCIWCQCGDLSGEGDCGITAVDYLYLLSEYGNPVNDLNNCADEMGRDNYVDLADLLAWSSQYHNPAALNLCSGSTGGAGGSLTITSVPADKPIITGKRSTTSQNDALYGLNVAAHSTDAAINAPAANSSRRSGHNRLVPGPDGEMYVLHGSRGLIKLSDATVKRAPARFCNFPTAGTVTRLGPTQAMGSPCAIAAGGYALADAAFDSNDANVLYVAPVEVIPPGGSGANCPYPAALKLVRADETSAYLPVQLYGENPAIGSSITIPDGAPCATIVYSPDRSRVREIEVDEHGNVFVLAAQQVMDNDYLIVYPATGGAMSFLLSGIEAPVALHYAADRLYLSTAADGPDATNTTIYRLTLDREPGGGDVSGVQFPPVAIPVGGVRFITSIRSDPADGSLLAVGFTSSTCSTLQCQTESECPGACVYGAADTIQVTPTMVTVANPATDPVAAAFDLTGADLVLPIDVSFPAVVPCGHGDFDGGGIGLSDVSPFVTALLNPTPAALCPGDMNHDGLLNARDIAPFVTLLTGP